MRAALTPLALVLALVGCAGERLDGLDAGQGSQDARIAELEAENAALQESLTALTERVDGLDSGYSDRVLAAEEALAALDGKVDGVVTDADDLDGRLTLVEGRLTTAEGDIIGNAADGAATQIRLGDAEEDIIANTDAIAANAAAIDKNATDISDNAGGISTNAASIATIETSVSDAEAAISDLDDAKISVVDTDTTLAVPGTYATVQDALDSLAQTRIVDFATVTIEIADGTHAQPGAIIVDHPDGHLIEIVGASGDPSRATLTFASSTGVYVPVGRSISAIEGVTLRGNGSGSTSAHGLFVPPNAFVQLEDVEIRNFAGDCINSFGNGTILAINDSVVLENCGGDGIEVGWGSVIVAQGVVSEDHGATGVTVRDGAFADVDGGEINDNGTDGVVARSHGVASADSASLENNGDFGALAFRYGVIDASSASLSNNGESGAYATIHGLINAYGSTAAGNGSYGFLARNYGEIDARIASISGNGDGESSPATGGAIFE